MYWKLLSSSSLDEWIEVELPVRLRETELHEELLEVDQEATAGVETDAAVATDVAVAADAAIVASIAADASATAAAEATRAAFTPSSAARAPSSRAWSSAHLS